MKYDKWNNKRDDVKKIKYKKRKEGGKSDIMEKEGRRRERKRVERAKQRKK